MRYVGMLVGCYVAAEMMPRVPVTQPCFRSHFRVTSGLPYARARAAASRRHVHSDHWQPTESA